MWRCHTQVETPFARKRSFDTLCSAMNLFSLTSQKAAWRIWFIHLRKRVAIKMFFFFFLFRKRRNIIRWFMIGGLLRRLVHLSIIIRKKKSKDGSKERTGYKAMECVFGNGYAPMDGWVRRSKRNRPAHLIIGCEERESLFSLSSPGPSKRKTTTKTR